MKADDGLVGELRPLALRVRAEQNTVSDGVRLAHLALRAIDEIERLGTRLDRVVETFNQSCDRYRQRAEQAGRERDELRRVVGDALGCVAERKLCSKCIQRMRKALQPLAKAD